jgi:hypothetical protein
MTSREAPDHRTNRVICASALACSGMTVFSVAAAVPVLARSVVVLLFCCSVPGTAMFATLRAWRLLRSPAASVAVSLAIVVILSQVALAAHLWAPATGTALLALACGVPLAAAVAFPRPDGGAT